MKGHTGLSYTIEVTQSGEKRLLATHNLSQNDKGEVSLCMASSTPFFLGNFCFLPPFKFATAACTDFLLLKRDRRVSGARILYSGRE